ncbi:hypothetical protein N2152v2_000525 [Parachlorella kessleri]
MRASAALALLVCFTVNYVQPQTCGSTDVRSKGAQGDGSRDDTGAFQAVDGDPSAGVIFMQKGTYRIARSVTLTKPVVATTGAVFKVEAGVTLTLANQPQHPYGRFFDGGGAVVFASGTQYVVPEWFGAKADGRSDDSTAIQKAYDAARATGNAMLYLVGTYGVGRATALNFAPGVVIMAEDTAKFVAVGGNSRGITFTAGNAGVKSVIPHLVGFSDFCLQMQAVSLGAYQLKTLTNCGDAIRFISPGPGQHCLDNTVWFNKIVNSRVAIAYRAPNAGCVSGNCIFQGNQVVGNAIQGGASSGESYAMYMYSLANPPPAWDSNNFDVSTIIPPSNPSYRVFAAVPSAAREIVKIGSLAALPHPSSRVFGSSKLDQMQELSGATTPRSSTTPVRTTTASNTKSKFNAGKAIHATYTTLQAVPATDWRNGEVRQFFFYHQQANQFLYQIKCNAPKSAKTNLPNVDCVQYNDNSGSVANEVALWLINQSGGTVRAGSPATLTIAVNTLGSA